MKIVVLGSKGMLGQMVKRYFDSKSNYDLVEYNQRFELETSSEYFNNIKLFGECVLINCIGLIPQKSTDTGKMFLMNSIFPVLLASQKLSEQVLIHASTDCVFEGNLGYTYSPMDLPNAQDNYGRSKAFGELGLQNFLNVTIIRTSIIGLDNISENPKGLLGWFLESVESECNGYANHFWNGITTLTWCEIVEEICIMNKNKRPRLLQVGSESISKYELLKSFQRVFKKSCIINECTHPKTTYKLLETERDCDQIEQQLKKMKNFFK